MPWYTLQLTLLGEKESSKSLTRTVKSSLGRKVEVFIPSLRGEGPGYRTEFCLVEGYVFVKYEGKNFNSLFNMEETPFFDSLVTFPDAEGRRQPQEMPESDIEEMRRRIREEMTNPDDLQVGERASVIDGDYRHLDGLIVAMREDMAEVEFSFHSKGKRVEIPLFCLRRMENPC